jgi:hypothetical protein
MTIGLLAPGIAQGASKPDKPATFTPKATGELDCNGLSPSQKPARIGMMCADPRGANGGRFSDNGHFLGHDQPSVRFLSSLKGSGRNFEITEKLPQDPAAAPTVATPGSDVTHFFELSNAPWISTVVCDPDSAPLLPCTPGSDTNARQGSYPGAGSAFVELQFYPPGFAPVTDGISCDNTHWCSALTVDSLECAGDGTGPCNNKCVEPVNFAFIQTDGVPTGPPNPQDADSATFTPTAKTLLMNPGDSITIRMFDATITGGSALEAVETDHTTGQSGFMIASGANGFMQTNPFTCDGSKFNFQPEFNTAKESNYLPWGVGPYLINDAYETGHFVACTSVTGSGKITIGTVKDTYYKNCTGPYTKNDGTSSFEPDQAPCFKSGDSHAGLGAAKDSITGCGVFLNAIADGDFDGSSYWPDWPDALSVNKNNPFPTPFVQQEPSTTGGKHFGSIQFMTDSSVLQTTAKCNLTSGSDCVLPPAGAGNFYPYFTLARVNKQCVWEFGNMQNGNSFGGDKQYGSVGTGTVGAFASKVQTSPGC